MIEDSQTESELGLERAKLIINVLKLDGQNINER